MLLNDIGVKYGADKSSIFHNYLDFYQEQLPDRDFAGRLLEIGVMDGLSMKMWREYYPKAEIVGIDIKDMDHMHNNDWQVPDSVKLIKCDGTDPKQVKPLGMFDIIIDDGSHYWAEQQKSFEILYYNQLNAGGVYILEDLWTSHIDYYANAKINTLEYLERLEKKGMVMTYFRHKHSGIQSVFPKHKGLAKLGSITVAIKAGQ
jgi:trans-aconitate methyltransferase